MTSKDRYHSVYKIYFSEIIPHADRSQAVLLLSIARLDTVQPNVQHGNRTASKYEILTTRNKPELLCANSC